MNKEMILNVSAKTMQAGDQFLTVDGNRSFVETVSERNSHRVVIWGKKNTGEAFFIACRPNETLKMIVQVA